jgi:putative zinc-dependent peptidase DUF5700
MIPRARPGVSVLTILGAGGVFMMVAFCGCLLPLLAQTNPKFNVALHADYSSARQILELFADEPVNTTSLAALRGNRIAASTTGLIADRGAVADLLRSYLDSLKYHQIIRDDLFHLETARKNAVEIKKLLEEMQKGTFNRRVVATVEQIFPADAEVSIDIPIYAVALGHENVDAYVRRIVWERDVPRFVGEGEGELTIVVNLSQSVNYGPDLQERYLSLLGVVAHEVFHAAFGAYKDRSRFWQGYYREHNRPFDALLDLTQNEGIAYYLSLDQRGRGYLPRDWNAKTRETFQTFNSNASELLSGSLTPGRASELIRTANLSGYWESYGAMTGMFIAREIDLKLGRGALIETISNGPLDMMAKYIGLTDRDSNLPRLSERIIREIPPK